MYYLPDNFQPVVAAHGNSMDKSREFHTTWASTKRLIETTAHSCGPKATVSKVQCDMGGVLNSSCPGKLPRNERQVQYAKHKMKMLESGSPDPTDELYTVMFRASNEDSSFVREIKVLPEPAVILCHDYQLNDLVRFTTDPNNCCVLTIDPTFSLGPFDVTPTTYRHLLLDSRRYGSSPVCIGPIMIHYKKSYATYHFFASSLVGMRKELAHLVAFGTDGEEALYDAFSNVFHKAVHLSCSIHARCNVIDKLRELKFPENITKSVSNDIFGNRSSDFYIEGLIDAEDDDDFALRFSQLKSSWMSSYSEITPFIQWFERYKLSYFRSTMIKSVRKAAIFSDTEHFTTNASEAVNMVLKSKMDYKKSDVPQLVRKLKELANDQIQEIENALLNKGKYVLKESYHSMAITESQWHRVSKESRKNCLRSFHNKLPVKHTTTCSPTVAPRPSNSSPAFTSCASSTASGRSNPTPSLSSSLSVSLEVAVELTSLSSDIMEGIWSKATKLLSTNGAIASAPGYSSGSRNVLSTSKTGFHTVKYIKNVQFVCDCPNFSSLKLCAHTIATAEDNGMLPSFMLNFKAVARPNITRLATADMPKGRGKKGNAAPKKRVASQPPQSTINPFCYAESSPVSLPTESMPAMSTQQNYSVTTMTASTINLGQQIITTPSSFSPSPPSYSIPNPLQSAQLWNFNYPPPYSRPAMEVTSPSYQYPPSTNQMVPFKVVFISGNIKTCQGCRNNYSRPLVPPNDICIQHCEWREYVPTGYVSAQTKWGNAYYHCNPGCIKAHWPSFDSSLLVIDAIILSKLEAVHKTFLNTTFGLSLF